MGIDLLEQYSRALAKRIVRSAMTPALWLCCFGVACWIAAYLFSFRAALVPLCIPLAIAGTLPLFLACWAYVYFALKKPDKLQSEGISASPICVDYNKEERSCAGRRSRKRRQTRQSCRRAQWGRLMMVYRCFLVGFNALTLRVQDLTDFFDTRAEIVNWYGILPGQVFVISALDAKTLNQLIVSRFPKGFFIVAQLDPSATDGWLPQEAWDFINEPKPSLTESLARQFLKTSTK